MANRVRVEKKIRLEPIDPDNPRGCQIVIHDEGKPVGFVNPGVIPDHVLQIIEDGKTVDLSFGLMLDLEAIDWETGGRK